MGESNVHSCPLGQFIWLSRKEKGKGFLQVYVRYLNPAQDGPCEFVSRVQNLKLARATHGKLNSPNSRCLQMHTITLKYVGYGVRKTPNRVDLCVKVGKEKLSADKLHLN